MKQFIDLFLFVRSSYMCGIVGYTGTLQAKGVLLEGLKRLEYRGYDSAGIAVEDGQGTISYTHPTPPLKLPAYD